MIDFVMPSLGADMDEGTLDQWLVKPGDSVSRGQVVAVVDTTKAAVEIECWHDGTVQELLVPVGETVEVGTPLARLLESGETALPPKSAARKPATATPPAKSAPHRRRWVSPAARRVAAGLGIDVETVTGTGPQGAVTINDVEHAAASDITPATATTAVVDRAVNMRRSIAAAMSRSKREIPHYYLAEEIRMDTALPG